MRRIISLAVMVICTAQLSFAVRPLTTDDAVTADPGKFEIEESYDYTTEQDDSDTSAANVNIIHGVTERMEIQLAVPYDFKPVLGLGSSAMKIKLAMIKDSEKWPDLALTYTNELGALAYGLNLVSSKEKFGMLIHKNIGYAATGVVGVKGAMTYGLGIEKMIIDKCTLAVEVFGAVDSDSDTDDPLEAMVGFSHNCCKKKYFDLGVGFGLSDASPKIRYTVGMTKSF